MAGLSIWHVIIFAIVVILLFGTSKLKNIGKDVGGAVTDFKKSMREEENIALKETNTLEHEETKKPSDSTINS
ncbi:MULTISPECIES: Sec-independent protein translocase subunit TatA [Acinetobacter]|uniref:Sec-independent protein translocase subunit TatA n=1 Tax=Acinetobacter TaxID=469 RepID=UPI0022E12C88|nr:MULTISPECIES: Sec-independent protein translocase subunit TatA [Acinetobacter]MDI1222523.1 Sec-independent protein translocase subunit TatA [Acinetobacter sp.]